jgi:pantoate--beta-alanine ligase
MSTSVHLPFGVLAAEPARPTSVDAVAITFDNPGAMRAWADATRADGRTIALVPTMGALHDGHLELVSRAARLADEVVVSIFVNPLQFGEHGDFEHYPRPLDDDLRACETAGVDVVYVPAAAAMYSPDFSTTVQVAGLSQPMEGESRPGHFDGVATVVTKLFAATRPDHAVFGEKDYQQLTIVRRLATDLDLGVEVVGHPTVREHDGLALSSRNRRLDDEQRRAAVCVPKAISAGVVAARSDRSSASDVIAAARRVIEAEPLASLDYVAVFDSTTLAPVDQLNPDHRHEGRVRIALAARFGDVRLIDNADLFAP